MLRKRKGKRLDGWLERATKNDVPASIRQFAEGLKNDLAAVRAALTVSWNNGASEGHISRLKMMKHKCTVVPISTCFGRNSYAPREIDWSSKLRCHPPVFGMPHKNPALPQLWSFHAPNVATLTFASRLASIIKNNVVGVMIFPARPSRRSSSSLRENRYNRPSMIGFVPASYWIDCLSFTLVVFICKCYFRSATR